MYLVSNTKPIHTTLSIKNYNYLKNIQKTNDCRLNEAIGILIERCKNTDHVIKKGILESVIDEVLDRYLQERRECK